jgi:WD40 repeat protein
MRPKARTRRITAFLPGLLIGSMVVLILGAALIVGALRNSDGPQQSQTIANVPPQSGDLAAPLIPVSTSQPTVGATPSRPVPPNTPTPVNLQPATMITPTLVSSLEMTNNALPLPKSSFDSVEAIHSLTWAPTGDKFLYVTNSGNLYWANLDGSSATLLHQYEPDTIWLMLEDQQPMSNTLILGHTGPIQGIGRGPGHLDVVHFATGQAPTLDEVDDAGFVFQIRWWRADRASGIVRGAYVGGDQLVTLDANGHLVEQRNVPYMVAGAVQPGGNWLAYVTDQEINVPFIGSSPQTVYLLNLTTGQRKQITAAGQGNSAPYGVHSWSPDGNWFLMGANVNGALRGVLVSADGQRWILVTPPGYSGMDAVWSPDSKHLAFSIQSGGQDEPMSTPVPYSSEIYLVDIPAVTLTTSDDGVPGNNPTTNPMMQPKWSPDGTQLALLSFDPACIPLCSGTSPAVYLMPFSSK